MAASQGQLDAQQSSVHGCDPWFRLPGRPVGSTRPSLPKQEVPIHLGGVKLSLRGMEVGKCEQFLSKDLCASVIGSHVASLM